MNVSRAAHMWLAGKKADGAHVSVVTIGVAAARRTGVAHHVADAAEVTVGGVTNLVASWLCGGSSVDAIAIHDETPECVGCRIAAAVPQGPVVYFAWGEEEELLYVGSSIQAAVRIRAHSTQTPWWPEVVRLTFEEHDTEVAARRAEAAAIRARPGTHNREGVRRPQSSLDGLLRVINAT